MCQTTFVITLDTDWVPQYVLDVALEQLREYKLPATVFCTSPYVFADDNIEPALHPNFFPGSSHGTTETECLGTVRAMYPLARGSRSHAYYWHSRMYALLTELGLNYDSSMLLPFQSHIIPNRNICFQYKYISKGQLFSGFSIYLGIAIDLLQINLILCIISKL